MLCARIGWLVLFLIFFYLFFLISDSSIYVSLMKKNNLKIELNKRVNFKQAQKK